MYQKIFKCSSIYIPIHIIPKVLNEKDIDLVIEEIVNNEDFAKSDTEIETYDSIEEISLPQEYEDGAVIILDDLNEKEMNDPRVEAMFKRSRHNNFPVFKIGQDYYELPKRAIRANGNIYHKFEPNNFRDVQNFYQYKAAMDMTISVFKLLTNICWKAKFYL